MNTVTELLQPVENDLDDLILELKNLIRTDKGSDVDEVLPAASVAVAVNEYVPSPRVEEVMENAPL